MKKRLAMTATLVALVFLASATITGTDRAQAAVSDWQKGATIFPTWTGDFDTANFRQSVQNLKATGATYVALVIPIYQANFSSSDIYPGGNTPSDQSITNAIAYIHSQGLHVMIKPHLDAQSGGWRADINAGNRDAWFANYGNFLNHLGDIGKQTGAEGMCIGTELVSMTTFTSNPDNTVRWQTVIGNLRTHFGGFLTYSANWGGGDFAEEIPHIGFWGSLDYIGISAYYPLAQGQSNPSIDALTGSWNYWDTNKIQTVHNQYNKPVLFTEIGYRSVNDAHNAPFDPNFGSGYNGTEQSNDYQALFQYWNNQPYMIGAYLWNWNSDPNNGGSGNTDYTPQNKPAQAVMTSWYSQGGSSPVSSSGSAGTWTISASATALSTGQPSTISVHAAITDHAANAIVDVEIYDSTGAKIFQKFFGNQNLTSSQAGDYAVAWTPPANGVYTLKAGAFSADWSANYYWNDSVLPLSVGQNGGNPGGATGTGTSSPSPAGNAVTDIWWPTDGATLSGLQPLKALLENKALSDYSMTWNVDSGQENGMYDSTADYPHKEAIIDFSGWNWNGNGPYKLNFTSRDGSGTVISRRSISIYVTH